MVVLLLKIESVVKINIEIKKARYVNQCVLLVNEKIYDYKRLGLEMIWECFV